MGFVVKSEPCLAQGCRMPITKADAAINVAFCRQCRNDLAKSRVGYVHLLQEANRIAAVRARVVRVRRRAQDDVVQDVERTRELQRAALPLHAQVQVGHQVATEVGLDALPPEFWGAGAQAPHLNLRQSVRAFKRRLVQQARDAARGNHKLTAELLGVNAKYLYQLIRELEVDDEPKSGHST